tara:strand:+ start:643 stop:1476 length:834 start_codon:yes stop_codon:yes gene_type:complete
MIEETTTTEGNPVEQPVEDNTVLGSTVSDNQDWRSNLPEDLKNDPTLSNFKDVESLAKTVVHQQKVLGNRIPIPKTDEERMEVYNKLGRPEAADKYEVNVPEDYSAYFTQDQISQFKNVAHQVGLNQQQVEALVNYQMDTIKNQGELFASQMDVQKQENENILKKEWGYDYDNQVRIAKRAVDVYGDNEIKQILATTEAGNHPAVVRLFARLGKDITEDMAQNTQNNTLATSPLDAKQEIQDTFNNPDHPYHNPRHKDHQPAVEKMRQLHEKVYGNS